MPIIPEPAALDFADLADMLEVALDSESERVEMAFNAWTVANDAATGDDDYALLRAASPASEAFSLCSCSYEGCQAGPSARLVVALDSDLAERVEMALTTWRLATAGTGDDEYDFLRKASSVGRIIDALDNFGAAAFGDYEFGARLV